MQLSFSQQMKMSQQMKLAPRMIQSMEILQLPLMALQERIAQEMSENPMLEAPEVLIVCYKMKPLAECGTLFELNPLASVWMCIENILLAMAAEGLYGCTYTPYEASGLKTAMGVPPGWEVAAVIPFGYPKTAPTPNEDEHLDSRLHIDAW